MADLTTDAVEIAPGTYWVGRREKGSIFHANPYLRIFPGSNGGGNVNLLIDPGSSTEFSVVQGKTSRLIGGIKNVHAVFLNHQDPDVASVAGPLLNRFAPHARVLCSEETWRLVHFFNINRERYIDLNPYGDSGFTLPTGHLLKPVPTPYCHFVGAVMLYDPETRVLFSGDLFGGLTDKDAQGLYADEGDWAGMRAFHQLYMPAGRALQKAVEAIRALDPFPTLIAPQHGRILQGEWIHKYLDRIESLHVGVDLLDDRGADDEMLAGWNAVLERVLSTARGYLGSAADTRLVEDAQLRDVLEPSSAGFAIKELGKWAIEQAVRLLTEGEVPTVANAVRYEAIFAAAELDLPAPNIELLEEGEQAHIAASLGSIGPADGGGGGFDAGSFVSPASAPPGPDGTLTVIKGQNK